MSGRARQVGQLDAGTLGVQYTLKLRNEDQPQVLLSSAMASTFLVAELNREHEAVGR